MKSLTQMESGTKLHALQVYGDNAWALDTKYLIATERSRQAEQVDTAAAWQVADDAWLEYQLLESTVRGRV